MLFAGGSFSEVAFSAENGISINPPVVYQPIIGAAGTYRGPLKIEIPVTDYESDDEESIIMLLIQELALQRFI